MTNKKTKATTEADSPEGNNRKKSKGNGKSKGNSRFPSGMTTKKAKADAKGGLFGVRLCWLSEAFAGKQTAGPEGLILCRVGAGDESPAYRWFVLRMKPRSQSETWGTRICWPVKIAD